MSVIELNQVVKRFGDITAVDHLDLEVPVPWRTTSRSSPACTASRTCGRLWTAVSPWLGSPTGGEATDLLRLA